MKKHLLALAALATVSGVAAAQSATVYGIVDLSVTSASKQTGGSLTALTDAVWMPSVFGITGSEDLGGGLKATFNLESDINADTGKVSDASSKNNDATSPRTLFGRKANVGLTGSFGTLTAGKDIDMLFLQGFIDNIRNSHSASGFVANAIANNNSFYTDGVFIENMVRYTTPTVQGLKASVQYRFGETAGQSGANNSTAFLVNYNLGAFNLNVGHKTVNDVLTIGGTRATGTDQKLTYVGANYTFDKFKVAATYHEGSVSGTSASGLADTKTHEIGASYAVSPKLTAAVNYVKVEKTGAGNAKNTSASLKYALSKRTSVWGIVSTVDNSSSGITDIARTVYPVASTATGGQRTTATSLGLTHTF
jgi:predicted porin